MTSVVLVVCLVSGSLAGAAGSRVQSMPPALQRAIGRLDALPGGPVYRLSHGSPTALRWVGRLWEAAPGRTPVERAKAFLWAHAELLPFDPADLGRFRTITWRHGEVVRAQLLHAGLPVFGTEVVVRLQGSHVTSLAVSGRAPLSFEPPVPRLGRAQVQALVASRGRSRVEGLGYLLRAGRGLLAWKVLVAVSGPPFVLRLLVADRDGSVLMAGPAALEARARVYDPNPVVAPNLQTVTLENLTSPAVLEGTYAKAFQCNGGADWNCPNPAHGAFADDQGDFLFDPIEPSTSDPFAEAQAYYHVDRFNRWLEDRFGFTWTCNGSRAIKVFVNWNYPNSFYGDSDMAGDGCSDLTLGQWNLDDAYDADVIRHEFTHGLVEKTANLGCPDTGVCLDIYGLNFFPYSQNEGTADYFSSTYGGDPCEGEYSAQDYGYQCIRRGDNQNVCPWDITGESHEDGKIWFGTFWTLRTALGRDKADDLAYGTLVAMPTDAQYDTAAQVLLQTAQEMVNSGAITQTDYGVVEQTLQQRGLPDCDRFVPLDGRPPGKETALFWGLQTFPGLGVPDWPSALQWTYSVPGTADGLSFSLWDQVGGSQWTVYLRVDQPVTFYYDGQHFLAQADAEFPGSPTWIQLTPTSNPPLQPGHVYYLAMVYQAPGEYGGVWTINAEHHEPEPEPPDAGPPDARPDVLGSERSGDIAVPRPEPEMDGGGIRRDGRAYIRLDSLAQRGCSCETSGGSGLPLFALFLLVLITRRRKR